MSEGTTEKVYCTGCNPLETAALLNSQNNGMNNPMAMMAMMNGNGFNQQWNNPMMYLVWMWMMRYMGGWGYGYGDGVPGAPGVAVANNEALNYNNRQITELRAAVDNNHNNDLVMDAIKGNSASIHELATNLNCDYNTLSQAICGVKSAIESVGANVGFSAERVINAVNQGDAGIISAVQTTSCATQKAIMQQGYENQLATERQTGILGSKIDNFASANALSNCQQTNTLQQSIEGVRQATVNGFSQIGYQMADDKSDIIQNQTANTQRIMDLLNNRWYTETSNALQDSKAEVSQLKQTQTILAALNKGCGCNC